MSKKELERLKNKNLKRNISMKKKKKKSTIEEEKDAHEAYQLILSEYHRRVKIRMKQKIKVIHMLPKPKADSDADSNEMLIDQPLKSAMKKIEYKKGGTQG